MMTAPTFNSDFERVFFQALRVRLVEEKIAEIYPSDKIQSPVHLSIGQEHLAAALCAELKPADLVFGTYRSHAIYLAKGGSLKGMLAELFGKAEGCGKGKAGSMHLADGSCGMMGASAIVGATLPHAVGAALAARVRKSGQVIATFFGEGATGQGVYHESLNIAALKNLPVVFVCENNGMAIYTQSPDIQAYDLRRHAAAYGIKTVHVADGYDFGALAEASREAVSFARRESRPVYFEVETYRSLQHVGPKMDFDMNYRDEAEYQRWAARDPLRSNTELVARFTPAILGEIEGALAFAERATFPQRADLFTDLM